ncbi:hypothetical protein [Couchioplanes azureus]|nr:hypothetical protein [Couchioplanes caeruleus]
MASPAESHDSTLPRVPVPPTDVTFTWIRPAVPEAAPFEAAHHSPPVP